MPFDNTNMVREVDPLEKLGIVPVPVQLASDYMRDYREKFLRSGRAQTYGGPFEWRWIDLPSKTSNQLRRALGSRMLLTDFGPAPKRLVDLACRARDAVPDAIFSVAYFYEDPVLSMYYDTPLGTRDACLGIWDGRRLKAIATDHAAPPSFTLPVTRFFNKIARFFMTPFDFH